MQKREPPKAKKVLVATITIKRGVCNFPYVVWLFFCNFLKFDIINVDIPFCKRGHNLETEVELNKAMKKELHGLYLFLCMWFC